MRCLEEQRKPPLASTYHSLTTYKQANKKKYFLQLIKKTKLEKKLDPHSFVADKSKYKILLTLTKFHYRESIEFPIVEELSQKKKIKRVTYLLLHL